MPGLSREQLMKLHEPFPGADIEWRIQQAGKRGDNQIWARVLAYVTNRAIMQRLDDVCGPENWYNVIDRKTGDDGKAAVLCGVAILTENGWITKYDGAEETDIESVKGGISAAMKRTAVQWGIGRYLYNLEAGYARVHEGGAYYTNTKDTGPFKWDPPALPEWALPAGKSEKFLKIIRDSFPNIRNDYMTVVEGHEVVLKDWLMNKDNGKRLQEDPALAERIAELCQATK
jgi:hypothetical protein